MKILTIILIPLPVFGVAIIGYFGFQMADNQRILEFLVSFFIFVLGLELSPFYGEAIKSLKN